MSEDRSLDSSLKEEAAIAEITPADVRLSAAMNLLARREHSVRELRNKLKRRFAMIQ